ncbi:phosphoglucomutase-2-like [Tropilaelaps mercedesae]|uniref:Phosphoglucomutase-2-like n=1 Tax=Tropilaelaps mercedesae TaxID=418985 RepID=A0A1V9X8Y0_9ACAR|nr:phosphoglucomutase-2-like [Tropilaelaps mercedesae]
MDQLTGDLRARVEEWMRWDQNPKTRAAVEALVSAGDRTRLEAVMLKRMNFGTAGLRGVMREGFACMNDLVIVQTSQGLAEYVSKTLANSHTKGVVISYDGRHNSERYASHHLNRIRHPFLNGEEGGSGNAGPHLPYPLFLHRFAEFASSRRTLAASDDAMVA